MRPFCRCVHLNALRCSVVLLCGDLGSDALKAAYGREMRRVKAGRKCPSYSEVTGKLDDGNPDPYRGITCCDTACGDCVIHMHEWSSGVFVHEAFHAVCLVMRARGIDDRNTEAGAFLIEYLFNEIVNAEWADRNFAKDHFPANAGINKKGKRK